MGVIEWEQREAFVGNGAREWRVPPRIATADRWGCTVYFFVPFSLRVCNVDLRLASLVAFRSRCGSGEIVRLKPDLLIRLSLGVWLSQSRSLTPESARGTTPPMSLEPGMTASVARARARGSQLGLTMPVPWEIRGRTALVKADRCATKYPRILSCVERGTGLDHGEGECSPVGATDHGAGLVALSRLALSISVRIQGVPASHRTGFKTASEMRLFWGQESHLVPFNGSSRVRPPHGP